MGRIIGLSRSNLFRKLKGLTGMSPSDLILKIKLNHAVELLKTKKAMRISDIAYESGFGDPKYFSTLFKKHYGKTPKNITKNLGCKMTSPKDLVPTNGALDELVLQASIFRYQLFNQIE